MVNENRSQSRPEQQKKEKKFCCSAGLPVESGVVTWESLLGYMILMAVGQFSPGPDMLLLTRHALASGVRVGCAMACGIAAGLVVHGSLAAFGVSYLIDQHTWVKTLLCSLAAVYLVYLAIMIWRSSLGSELKVFEQGQSSPAGLKRAWLKGFLCNILNPKVAFFLSTVMLPFLRDHQTGVAIPLLLVGVVVVEGALLWCCWVVLLQQRQVRAFYRRVWRWLDRSFSFGLLVLAGILVVELLQSF